MGAALGLMAIICTFMLLAICAALAGCSSTPSEEYPWHGPLVGPDGNPPPQPSYTTGNTNDHSHP